MLLQDQGLLGAGGAALQLSHVPPCPCPAPRQRGQAGQGACSSRPLTSGSRTVSPSDPVPGAARLSGGGGGVHSLGSYP